MELAGERSDVEEFPRRFPDGEALWLFPATGTLRMKLGDVQVFQGGQAAASGPTQAQKLLAASRTTDYLHAAILLWAVAEPAWWRLYRIVEELIEYLGMTPAKAGLCSAKELKRFERTANSADAPSRAHRKQLRPDTGGVN